jgi:hypothetical protein
MILSSPIPILYLCFLAQPAPPIAILPIPKNENDTGDDDDRGGGSNATASNNNNN